MPRMMTKENAREILLQVCDQFHKPTGEFVGITYAWAGGLNILGPRSFREILEQNKEEIWKNLAFHGNIESTLSKALLDKDMFNFLDGDNAKYTMNVLRKIISWATHNSAGRSKNVWGIDRFRPSWWPNDIPSTCISKHTKEHKMDRDKLLRIVEVCKQSIGLNDVKSAVSTPQKRKTTFSNSEPLIKKEKLDATHDDISNSSFFSGLIVDTPKRGQTNTHRLAHSNPTSITKNSQNIIKRKTLPVSSVRTCIDELSIPTAMLTYITINAFCKILKKSYPAVNGLQDTILSQKMKFDK